MVESLAQNVSGQQSHEKDEHQYDHERRGLEEHGRINFQQMFRHEGDDPLGCDFEQQVDDENGDHDGSDQDQTYDHIVSNRSGDASWHGERNDTAGSRKRQEGIKVGQALSVIRLPWLWPATPFPRSTWLCEAPGSGRMRRPGDAGRARYTGPARGRFSACPGR